MKRLGLALFLLAAPLAAVDTVIFTETCATNPAAALPSSTTVTVGTSWGAKVALVLTTATIINSGTADCAPTGGANRGYGYIASPNPTTDTYYADFSWIDKGVVNATVTLGFLVNYIDTSNYYACIAKDDATTGACDIVKVAGGVGSALATGTCSSRATAEVLECKIDYSGASPVITFTNTTDSTQYATATDSSSPLTKTKAAGVMAGGTPQATADDADVVLGFDTFRVVEVSAAAAGRPRPPWFGRAF